MRRSAGAVAVGLAVTGYRLLRGERFSLAAGGLPGLAVALFAAGVSGTRSGRTTGPLIVEDVVLLRAQHRRARDEGDLPATSDPALLACSVATVGNGIAVQTAGGAGPDELHPGRRRRAAGLAADGRSSGAEGTIRA